MSVFNMKICDIAFNGPSICHLFQNLKRTNNYCSTDNGQICILHICIQTPHLLLTTKSNLLLLIVQKSRCVFTYALQRLWKETELLSISLLCWLTDHIAAVRKRSILIESDVAVQMWCDVMWCDVMWCDDVVLTDDTHHQAWLAGWSSNTHKLGLLCKRTLTREEPPNKGSQEILGPQYPLRQAFKINSDKLSSLWYISWATSADWCWSVSRQWNGYVIAVKSSQQKPESSLMLSVNLQPTKGGRWQFL